MLVPSIPKLDHCELAAAGSLYLKVWKANEEKDQDQEEEKEEVRKILTLLKEETFPILLPWIKVYKDFRQVYGYWIVDVVDRSLVCLQTYYLPTKELVYKLT